MAWLCVWNRWGVGGVCVLGEGGVDHYQVSRKLKSWYSEYGPCRCQPILRQPTLLELQLCFSNAIQLAPNVQAYIDWYIVIEVIYTIYVKSVGDRFLVANIFHLLIHLTSVVSSSPCSIETVTHHVKYHMIAIRWKWKENTVRRCECCGSNRPTR